MTPSQREAIRLKCNGRCAYCGTILVAGWHVDHLRPIHRISKRVKGKLRATGECRKPQHEHIDNLMPSCASCNIAKRTLSLAQFRAQIKGYIKSLNRDSTQYKIAKRYGLVVEVSKPVLFYFETLK